MLGRYRGLAYGLGSGIFWGLDAVLLALCITLAEQAVPTALLSILPLAVIALHDCFSALWLLLDALRRGRLRVLRRHLFSRDFFVMLAAACCGGPLGMSCYVLAIQHIGPGPTAVVSAIYPALGVLFAVLWGRDVFRPHMGYGLAIAISATLVLSYTPIGMTDVFGIGLLYGLLCAVGWGLECVICSYGFAHELPPDTALLLRQAISGLVYGVCVLPFFGAWEYVPTLIMQTEPIVWLVLTALAGTISYSLYYRAIATIGPIRGMGLNITYSAWAVFIGALLPGGSLSLGALAAACGVMAGSLWTAAPLAVWRREIGGNADR